MINFILPMLYENLNFNNYLTEYIKAYPEHLNYNNINILAQSGNPPFSFWHGGLNTCAYSKRVLLYPELMNIVNFDTKTPIILDFSNIYLDINPNWIFDPHVKMILEVFSNRGNYIKVSNDCIRDRITTFYPNYYYIYKNYNNNLDAINIDNYSYVEQASQSGCTKTKIINILYNKCELCPKHCLEEENLAQFSFSQKSAIKECNISLFNINQLRERYESLRHKGISTFYFGDTITESDLGQFNQILILFFIKPEYRDHFYGGYYD